MAHTLFEDIIYDLDRQRIVDFHLKGWVEGYLVLHRRFDLSPQRVYQIVKRKHH
jgi:hypothetical protein